MTAAHRDESAAELADGLSHAIAASIRGAELLKRTGQAVMLRLDEPSEAVRLGLRISHELWTGHGRPAAAVGIHHGVAVKRRGDWFGSTVHVPARLGALAPGGEVLVSSAVESAVRGLSGVRFEPQGDHRVRNLPTPMTVFAARMEGRSCLPTDVDPVCRMIVGEGLAAATRDYLGSRYRFCSQECVACFAADPDACLRHTP